MPHRDPDSAVDQPSLQIGGAEVIDDLAELWLSLFDHHACVGSAGLPTIDRADSWPRRRRLYQGILSDPRAFVVTARRGDRVVGYALGQVHQGPDDTWPTGDLIGEIETLAVLPEERGRGLGTRLLDAAEARLAGLGARDVIIAVLAGNVGAERFYARRGMAAVMTKYLRLGTAPD